MKNSERPLPIQKEQVTFEEYFRLWRLVEDGQEIETSFSRLIPVRRDGRALMLKLLFSVEEQRGSRVMQWWEGEGAAQVLDIDDRAVLLERAMGSRSLVQMAADGQDDEATRILCAAARELHKPRVASPPADAVPLAVWFRALWASGESDDPFFKRAVLVARELIDDPLDEAVLHGDIHHGNVLDFGERGWLAIDPKGLIGEKGFDFANIFRNPPTGRQHGLGRMERLSRVISEETGIPEERLLRWVVAFTGLSKTWAEQGESIFEGDHVLGETAAGLLGL